MSRVKVKRTIPKETQADINEITKMFDQMTGGSNADREVIIPKFVTVRNRLRDYYKVYKILVEFEDLKTLFSEYKNAFEQIAVFISDINLMMQEYSKELNMPFDMSNSESIDLYQSVSEIDINRIWKKLKDESCVKAVLITTGRLKRFEQFLTPNKLSHQNSNDMDSTHRERDSSTVGDKFVVISKHDTLDDGFIKREPGLDMILLSFADLDFKQIWASEKLTPMIKKLLLNILSKTYNYGFEIYDLVTSPDVDIKKFSSLLINSIQTLKHQIPRCDKAFDIIADSVKLLESNFKEYYRSSIEAQNPSVILESFIVDVSMKQKNNIHVMNQFKIIIRHLQKNSSNIKDPRVKSVFSMLNKQINIIDEKYQSVHNREQHNEQKNQSTESSDASSEVPTTQYADTQNGGDTSSAEKQPVDENVSDENEQSTNHQQSEQIAADEQMSNMLNKFLEHMTQTKQL